MTRRLDISALAMRRVAPTNDVERFICNRAPVSGEEGTDREWQQDFLAAMNEAYEEGRTRGHGEAAPTEGMSVDLAVAYHIYASAAMTLHRWPSEGNKTIASQAIHHLKYVRHKEAEKGHKGPFPALDRLLNDLEGGRSVRCR